MEGKIKIKRETKETSIELEFVAEGTGKTEISTAIPFFNHMLEAMARHGRFDLKLKASGDIEVDPHHLIEDTGICLGKAVREYYSGKSGITRSGSFAFPMDDALCIAAIDLSGRSFAIIEPDPPSEVINGFNLKTLKEFFNGFASEARANVHIVIHHGNDAHHIYESMFKAFGRALEEALSSHPREHGIPSTKGKIE